MKTTGIIEVFKDKKKGWRFRVKSKNGKIVAQSEGYKQKHNAYKGIEALKKIFKDCEIKEND